MKEGVFYGYDNENGDLRPYLERYSQVQYVHKSAIDYMAEIEFKQKVLLAGYAYRLCASEDLRATEPPESVIKALTVAPLAIKHGYVRSVLTELQEATIPYHRGFKEIDLKTGETPSYLKVAFPEHEQEITQAYEKGVTSGIHDVLDFFQGETPLLPELRFRMVKQTSLSQELREQDCGIALDLPTKIPGMSVRYTYEQDENKAEVIDIPHVSLWIMPLSTSPRR